MPRSVMDHNFSEVPSADIPRSSFDRSHRHLLTMDADYLVPILVDDIIPGDTFRVNCNFFARLTSPTVLPLMDNMYLDTFWFFVPYRLLWTNFEKFMGAQDDPNDSIAYTIPEYFAGNTNLQSASDETALADYMGMPLVTSFDGADASALPFRAYNLIWAEWFRDQNLQDSPTLETDDGPDNLSTYPLRKRGKRHDYFTSSLPWPQKGTAVGSPVEGVAYIDGIGWDTASSVATSTDKTVLERDDINNVYDYSIGHTNGQITMETESDGQPLIEANMAKGTVQVNINDLRLAFQTQKLLERDARSGTRYVETLLAHWGVRSPDFRLQRPEFLGGGSTRINLAPVAQTTYQGTQTLEDGKGALASIGTVAGSHSWTKSFVEHGVVLGLANVRSDISYSQGLERYWSKRTRYEFYYPVLAQIGEQSVLDKEIFYANDPGDEHVWGYQERYAEYRYKPSRMSGRMRPDHPNSIDQFHLSEDFATKPSLDSTFIESNTAGPLDRAISVPSEPQFVLDCDINMRCARPMPTWGVPGNLDRF